MMDVREFVRFHPIVKNHEKCKYFYEVIQLGGVVHLDLSSPESIWSNITSKNWNVIRKAIRNDVKIYNGCFPEIYEMFRVFYNGTMDKDDAEAYYCFAPEFYESAPNDHYHNTQLFGLKRMKRSLLPAL